MTKEESSSKSEKAGPENEKGAVLSEAEQTEVLDHLILNNNLNKYDTILLARRWAYELKSKDQESRSIQELIPQAITDILALRVNTKMVRDLPILRISVKKQKPTIAILDNIGKAAPESEPEKAKSEKSSKKKS